MPYFKLGMDKKVIVPYTDYLAAMKPDFKFVGDRNEIKDLVRCLFLPNANSVKLVAKRGVGATSLIDGLVQEQNADYMPDDILTRPIFKLNSSNLFNTSDAKTTEARFKSALEELKSFSQLRKVKPILVIDDGVAFVSNAQQHMINSLIEAAVTADYVDLIVGVDEKKEKDFDAKHPEFVNSFTVKQLEEPKREILFDIIKHQAKKHEANGVIISDETINHIIDITERFKGLYDTAQPNRALRLLDSSATAFRLDIHSRPPGSRSQMEDLESLKLKLSAAQDDPQATPEQKQSLQGQIETLELEISESAAEWNAHREKIKAKQKEIKSFDRLVAETQIEIEKLDNEIKDMYFNEIRGHLKDLPEGHEEFKGKKKDDIMGLDRESLLQFAEFDINVTRNPKVRELNKDVSRYTESIQRLEADLKNLGKEMHISEQMPNSFVDTIASAETGTPVGGISGRLRENLLNGVELMSQTVFGQDHVIEPIIRTLRQTAAGLADPNRPLGVFLIAGPPGTGKSYTGEQLAEIIFGSKDFFHRIDMENYKEKHSVSRLISAPPGYAGYEERAELVEVGQNMPFGVLLLDEIEKAHPEVRAALLKVIEKGELKALNGEEADFRNIVIIQTSNYAQDVWLENDFPTGERLLNERLRSDVHTFSPEYLDRQDAILCAAKLDETSLTKIVKKQIADLQKESARLHPDLKIDISPEDIAAFTRDHCIGGSGRNAKRLIRKSVGDPLTDIKLGDPKANGALKGVYDPEKKAFDFEHIKGNVQPKPANENKAAAPAMGEAFKSAEIG